MGHKKKNTNQRQPVWQDIIPAKNIPKTHPKKPSHITKIKLSLRHFLSSQSFTKTKLHILKTPKRIWIIVIAIIILILTGLIFYLQSSPTSTSVGQNVDPDNKTIDTGADSNQPKYKTVAPSGIDIGQLGGWTRVSPINSNPVFAYVDHIGNIPIRVSQQPLPDEFRHGNTESQIDQLAVGYDKITVGNISVHIGTSSKGPQFVIFSKNDLLILITSNTKITNDQWAHYVSSLQ